MKALRHVKTKRIEAVSYSERGLMWTCLIPGKSLYWENAYLRVMNSVDVNGKNNSFLYFHFPDGKQIKNPNYEVVDYVPINHIREDGSIELIPNSKLSYTDQKKNKSSLQNAEMFFFRKALHLLSGVPSKEGAEKPKTEEEEIEDQWLWDLSNTKTIKNEKLIDTIVITPNGSIKNNNDSK